MLPIRLYVKIIIYHVHEARHELIRRAVVLPHRLKGVFPRREQLLYNHNSRQNRRLVELPVVLWRVVEHHEHEVWAEFVDHVQGRGLQPRCVIGCAHEEYNWVTGVNGVNYTLILRFSSMMKSM